MVTEGGGFLCIWHEPSIYEYHTNFLKSFRGAYFFEAAWQARHLMFTRTDCMTLMTKVPAPNKGAKAACQLLGETKEFERRNAWAMRDGSLVDLSYWAFRYDDWVVKAPGLVEAGRLFHMKLDAEFSRHGKTQPHHPEEDCHDRYVGACVETLRGGQPEKAVILYNRWARFAGYGEISLVARNPLVIDIGDAVIQIVDDQNFKVLVCR